MEDRSSPELNASPPRALDRAHDYQMQHALERLPDPFGPYIRRNEFRRRGDGRRRGGEIRGFAPVRGEIDDLDLMGDGEPWNPQNLEEQERDDFLQDFQQDSDEEEQMQVRRLDNIFNGGTPTRRYGEKVEDRPNLPRQQLSPPHPQHKVDAYIGRVQINLYGETEEEFNRKVRRLEESLTDQGFSDSEVSFGMVFSGRMDKSTRMEYFPGGRNTGQQNVRLQSSVLREGIRVLDFQRQLLEQRDRERMEEIRNQRVSDIGSQSPDRHNAPRDPYQSGSSSPSQQSPVGTTTIPQNGSNSIPKSSEVYSFVCQICNELISTDTRHGKFPLIKHALHHHQNMYKCKFANCNARFNNEHAVKVHSRKIHNMKASKCYGITEMWKDAEFHQMIIGTYGEHEYLKVKVPKGRRKTNRKAVRLDRIQTDI